MALHEIVKVVKVIDEIMIYLVNKGYEKVSVDYDKSSVDTKITFVVSDPKRVLFTCVTNEIYCERDYELEEYGWELMGEDDTCCELQQVGMLMDQFEVLEDGDNIKLIFTRKS